MVVACFNCGTLTRNNKFCSRRCSAIVTNSTHPRRKKGEPGTKAARHKQCSYCGAEMSYRTKRAQCKSCGDFAVVESWINGEIDGTTPGGNVLRAVYRYVLAQAGNKCSKCNWCEVNQKTGRSPLEVNHIDGNHRNSRPENLEVLCPNCHSLTPNYKALNKGNGRRERYAWKASVAQRIEPRTSNA